MIILRRTKPDMERGYRVPFVPWFPIIGILLCVYLAADLELDTWLRFLVWMGLGLLIYFVYGYRHSRLRKGEVVNPEAELPDRSFRPRRGGQAVRGSFPRRGSAHVPVRVSSLRSSRSASSRRSLAEAADELSTSNRLDDRRFVTSGPRAYEVGTEAGRYPAMGFHTRGEMGGVWTPPIKLVDGIWFGLGKRWIGPATRFTSGYGHVRMRLPGSGGLSVERTDFVPGEARGVLVGLTLQGQGPAHGQAAHADPLRADVDLPLGRDEALRPADLQPAPTRPRFARPLADLHGAGDAPGGERRGAQLGRRRRQPPAAAARAHRRRLPRPAGAAGHLPRVGPRHARNSPQRCDDTAYGKGKGGELTYKIKLPALGPHHRVVRRRRLRDRRARRAPRARPHARPPGARRCARRSASARRCSGTRRLDLPGDPLLARGIDWSKQNLADSVQEARDLEIRETNAGTRYPPPEGTLDRARFVGAGFPDYPWLFATDGEFTAFASVALGQFEPIKEHLRALRRASLIDNGDSGKVVHEVITDGSVFFGSNADPGNTDETAKFPSTVALIWRWTGDDAFRDEMYDFAKSNMEYIFRELDDDSDGWPEGLGNVEREGMGPEKLDNTTATMRGLRDLEDLAKSKGDTATATWAGEKAADLEARFETDVVDARDPAARGLARARPTRRSSSATGSA